ncbi:hypothetical protein AWH48_11950 [Domibacillus aminovorans]|uniref:Uncharacterized protein n=1 Tax=Domibacillus aminovorans TaxID=29332 RepID=A0A177KJK2_9BACI|nr:hypothetical protein [Domibacillus aminovorans]OAH53065.1 hypothetical protein AWH48_11950 [Domibacillus aminovorans]
MTAPVRVLPFPDDLPIPVKNNKHKAIWVWNTYFVKEPDFVIGTCRRYKITTIYIGYKFYIQKATDDEYRAFIRKATSKGITVEALHGDPNWARNIFRYAGTDVIEAVHQYNISSAPEERFTGIHFDVEPHGMRGQLADYPDLWNIERVQLMRDWINNSIAWRDNCHSKNLTLGGAFAFWLDDTETAPTPPEFGTQPMSEIIMDIYDYYATMAYRDSPAETFPLNVSELAYAEQQTIKKKLVIGMETRPEEPLSISYYDEILADGYDVLEQATSEIDDYYTSSEGYGGIAFHHFEVWIYFLAAKSPARQLAPIRVLSNNE